MTASGGTWWKRALPAVAWLRGYQRSWFRLDFAAGITLLVYLHLDRIEVGAIGRRNKSQAPMARIACSAAALLWAGKLSKTTTSPGLKSEPVESRRKFQKCAGPSARQ